MGERPPFKPLLGSLEIGVLKSIESQTFRLFKGNRVVRFEVITDHHWRVIAASPETGSKVGDEVSPITRISWRKAKRRVNSIRTALSPDRLVLLTGDGFEHSRPEVQELLRTRPWDPETPPPAA
jgi:hypothetical protein